MPPQPQSAPRRRLLAAALTATAVAALLAFVIHLSGPAPTAEHAASASPTPAPTGAVALPGPMTARVGQAGGAFSDGSATEINTRTAHRATCTCGNVQVAWGNWMIDGQGTDVDGPNAFGLAVAIEYPAGTFHPVAFGGARSVAVPPGETVISDPVEDMPPIPVGETFFVRAYLTAGNGGRWPVSAHANAVPGVAATTDEGFVAGTADLDGTLLPLSSPTTTGAMPAPLAVFGTPASGGRAASVAAVGDSILWGDTGNTAPVDGSWLTQALRDRAGIIGLSKQGAMVTAISEASARHRLALAPRAATFLSDFGINDLARPWNAEQVKAALVALWHAARARGMRVVQTTLTPRTTSADGFTTVEGQTPPNWEAERVTVNEWLRGGADGNPDLDGIVDVADAAESSRNSGRWKPGLTNDGTHPSVDGQAAIGRSVDVGALLVAP